ncbi:alpha/beta hydrolase [Pseudonocardia petroleophila]|uniref:Alpha/beta hydrolase n=1 Tax=Pseudonocardia petroleophila TaxID=37331 RepID=A0A7G7MI16_9PSEU|nr:alpha/beta hydrolase [Pseudonocardia petroleophila]QNG52427.1 alpha/beta hydrolase [Pseudonocardia petroleophila]
MTAYVLVHGGFTDGWYWGATARLLEEQGHRVTVAELPSTGTDPAVLGTVADDVAEVRRLVAAAGEPAVLVGHSYGGLVITDAADEPGIVHRVYVSAFWPARGRSLMDDYTGPTDWFVPTEDGTAARITDDVDRAAEVLYADLDPAQRAEFHRHLMFSSGAAIGAPATAPDSDTPVTYVVLEKDVAVPPEEQEAMATRADRVERMATSHCPQLVDPTGLAAILSRIPA